MLKFIWCIKLLGNLTIEVNKLYLSFGFCIEDLKDYLRHIASPSSYKNCDSGKHSEATERKYLFRRLFPNGLKMDQQSFKVIKYIFLMKYRIINNSSNNENNSDINNIRGFIIYYIFFILAFFERLEFLDLWRKFLEQFWLQEYRIDEFFITWKYYYTSYLQYTLLPTLKTPNHCHSHAWKWFAKLLKGRPLQTFEQHPHNTGWSI